MASFANPDARDVRARAPESDVLLYVLRVLITELASSCRLDRLDEVHINIGRSGGIFQPGVGGALEHGFRQGQARRRAATLEVRRSMRPPRGTRARVRGRGARPNYT